MNIIRVLLASFLLLYSLGYDYMILPIIVIMMGSALIWYIGSYIIFIKPSHQRSDIVEHLFNIDVIGNMTNTIIFFGSAYVLFLNGYNLVVGFILPWLMSMILTTIIVLYMKNTESEI